MATILVDTDVYSYLISTNPKRALPYKPHLEGNAIALSFITVGELYAGFTKKIAKGEWGPEHLHRLEARLRLVVVIPYDIEVARAYGNIKGTLEWYVKPVVDPPSRLALVKRRAARPSANQPVTELEYP